MISSTMCLLTDLRPCLFVLLLFYVAVTVSEGKPQTPKKFYAVTSSTVEIPCAVDSPRSKPRWYPERNTQASSRTSSHIDNDDSELLIYVIRDVQLSDAGRYICSDGHGKSRTQLVVIEPSPIRDGEAHTNGPDEIKVKWKSPHNDPEAVISYNIYVTEVQTGKEAKVSVDTVNPKGVEEFPLTDFSPGTTYFIEVAPLYLKGADDIGETTEGPRSPKIEITTPKIEVAPWNVSAAPGANSSVLVTWRTPSETYSHGVDGYIVYYQGIVKKDAPSGEVRVPVPERGNQGSAVLKGLKLRQKYKIRVAPYTGRSKKILGPSSLEIVYTHDVFVPELSIRAVALSPDTALVSLDTVGGDKVEKLRIFVSDDSAIKWDKVEGFNTKEKYVVVTGLQPRSRYFFMAKGAVNKKARSVVTHLFTPPADLVTPTNVSVTAKSDSSVLVTWDGRQKTPAGGFIVLVTEMDPTGSFSTDKHHVVFKQNEALVQGLDSDKKYQVKVEPFDSESVGTCSDSILFRLSAYDQTTISTNEGTLPRFVNDQPEELEINAGEDIRLTCTAIGSPRPQVMWLKNDIPITEPAEHVSELVLSDVQEHVTLTCVAKNSKGTVTQTTDVKVTEDIETEPPRILEPTYRMKPILRGTELRQVCEATGYPVPTITWYKDDVLVQSYAATTGRSEFVEKQTTREFMLRCVASNALGTSEHGIKIVIMDPLLTSDYNIILREVIESQSAVKVKWIVDRGDLDDIRHFEVTLTNDKQETLITKRLDSDKRSTTFSRLSEHAWYTVVLKTVTRIGVVDISNVTFTTGDLMTSQGKEPVIYLDVSEIRHNAARIDYVARNVNPKRLRNYRLLVKDLSFSIGNTILTKERQPTDPTTIIVDRFKPHRNYQVIIEAVGKDLTPLLTVAANFSTPGEGEYGVPVSVSSLPESVTSVPSTVASVPTTVTSVPTTTTSLPTTTTSLPTTITSLPITTTSVPTTPTSVPTTTTSVPTTTTSVPTTQSSPTSPTQKETTRTRATTATTTRTRPTREPRTVSTESVTIISTPFYVTSEQPDDDTTTESPESHDYVMTAKITNKTPFMVDISWTVHRGPLENIKNFTVTIMGVKGSTLLKQTLSEGQRYITIQSLGPNTKYFVNVRANGPDGPLVESNVDFKTHPADYVPDTSNPVLELEASEVRADGAKIDWTVVNAKPNLVKGYRLHVLDGGPGGFNLLTESLDAKSQYLSLQKLQPSTRYHVIVDGLAADDSVLMSSSLTFETAAPNRYGSPVYSSSDVPESRPASHPRDVATLDPTLETSALAELDLKVESAGTSSTRLSWSTRNVVPGSVSGYSLKVRTVDPEWRLLLVRDLSLQSNSFKIDGLQSNKEYFLQLDAVSPSGATVLQASTLYTPGRTVTPIQVRSTPGGPGQDRSAGQGFNEENHVADDPNPDLELELTPVGEDKVRVNWTVTGHNSARPIASYKVKVLVNGPEGQILLEKDLSTRTLYYTIHGLEENTRFHIRLEALDTNGGIIQQVDSPYLVPPPGHAVEPIRTSSAFNRRTTSQSPVPSRDRGPNNSELVITKAVPQGQNGLLVEWHDIKSNSGQTRLNTMVQYAEYKDGSRDNFQIESVPAGQQRLVIPNLKADSVYGVQVAPMGSGGRFMRWSKLSFIRLP